MVLPRCRTHGTHLYDWSRDDQHLDDLLKKLTRNSYEIVKDKYTKK